MYITKILLGDLIAKERENVNYFQILNKKISRS